MKLKLLPILIFSGLRLSSQSHSHIEIPQVLKEFSYSDCQLTLSKNAQQLKELGKKDAYNYSTFSAITKGADNKSIITVTRGFTIRPQKACSKACAF